MKKFLFFVMALIMSICSASAEVVTIKVDVPGTLETLLLSRVDQLTDVTELTVIGKLDSYTDLDVLPKLKNVRKIDMSHTNLRWLKSCENLTKLEKNFLSSATKTIAAAAFDGCGSLTTVSAPMVESIGHSAFDNCGSLKKLVLPSSLRSLGYIRGMFGEKPDSCDNIVDVYCYVIKPFDTPAFNWMDSKKVTLHVPSSSVNTYRQHKDWNCVGRIVALEDKIDKVSIFSDYIINDNDINGIAQKADLDLGYNYHLDAGGEYCAHLTVSANEKWSLKDYSQTQMNLYGSYTSLIPNSEMTADNVAIKYAFRAERWYFISFPFDVKVADIEFPEGTKWVIRRYSGEDRAKKTGNTWQNMTRDMILKAGEGYIFQCYAKYGSYGLEFTFKAMDNGNKNNIFTTKDVIKSLSTYASDYPHNRSWNLVGNPYPCFFDTRYIEHDGIITIWNGDGYSAYSLRDDNFVLHPHQSFFVQCPDGASSMKFKADGRQHSYEVEDSNDASYAKSYNCILNNTARQVYNLTLSGADYTDKARVVINESALKDYEISCDASKFMSSNATVPQLYIIEGNQKMAIDERPLSDGTVALGMYIGEPGYYTIALATGTNDCVMLIDSATGNTTNLNAESYRFLASRGVINNRFVIQIGDATAIKQVSAEELSAKSIVYGLGGQRFTSPQKGINIIDGKKYLVK